MRHKKLAYFALGYLVMRWLWKHAPRREEDLVARLRAAGAI
jgi:hypothetical protein